MKSIHWIALAIVATTTHTYAIETMDELIVQSTRIETPLSLMSSSVEIITEEQLKQSGVPFVSEALEQLSGIQVTRDGGAGQSTSIYLRGAKPQHTLVLIDGVRMNGQLDLNGYDLANLEVNNIEKIEVLKGPQSALYGSDAMAGVINIITKSERGPIKGSITTEIGSYESRRTVATAGGGTDVFYFSLAASIFDQKGFSASKNNTDRDGLLNKTFSANIGGKIKTGTEWKAVVRHLQANAEYDQFSPTDAYEKEQLNSRVHFSQQALNDQLTFNASISYLALERFQASTQFDSETLSSDVNILAQHALANGLFGIDTSEDTYKVTGSEQIEGDLNNVGIYSILNIHPITPLNLTLSGRRDNHSRFGNKTTSQVAANYQLLDNSTILRGAYGTGFKAPNSYHLSYNNQLQPEESWGWEVGIDQPLLDTLMLNITYFKKEYANFIDWRDVNQDTDYSSSAGPGDTYYLNDKDDTYANYADANTKGMEVTINIYPADSIQVDLGYTRLNNSSSDSSFTRKRPKHKVNASLNYQANEKWNFSTYAAYLSRRQDTTLLKAYTIVNVSARYAASEKLEFFGRVENATDTNYEVVSNYNTPGLSFYGGMRVQF